MGILMTFSQPLPPSRSTPLLATIAWPLALSNGWCLYVKLYNVSDACEFVGRARAKETA